MKRLFYSIAAVLALGMIVACENEPKNPGDFNKACTLDVAGPVVSLKTGKTYELKVARETDTVYKYLYVLKDTMLDDAGKPIIGSNGQPITKDDSVYIYSKIKARLIEMEPLYLPGAADTFCVDINSNARWLAPAPILPGDISPWIFNHNSSTTGGGDSQLLWRTIRNRSNTRSTTAMQQIITSDSTVMYRIPIKQYGERDQPTDY